MVYRFGLVDRSLSRRETLFLIGIDFASSRSNVIEETTVGGSLQTLPKSVFFNSVCLIRYRQYDLPFFGVDLVRSRLANPQ